MKVVVSDTCVFIDIVDCDIVKEFFRLDIEVHTNDFIISELDDSCRAKFVGEKLFIDDFNEMAIEEIVTFRAVNAGLSFADGSAFIQARDMSAVLLTNDKRLRMSACDSLEVHGVLWIFDELVKHNILTRSLGCKKLELLVQCNPRLPKDEIARRLREWST